MPHGTRCATLRSGCGKEALSIRARGRHRFGIKATPNDITLTRWNGRGGETQISATATGQVQVLDRRNPRYNAMR